MVRLKAKYNDEVVPKMKAEFGYKNRLQVPRLEKVVLNVGLGEAIEQPKLLDAVENEIACITGQKPVRRKARKSIASFKLRAGMPIGCNVTLRGNIMYEFFDRFVNVAIPRIRDFRGLERRSFDGRGNYSLGIKEQLIFPEVDYDKVEQIHGMDITFCTTAKSNKEAESLLRLMGMPFKK